MEERVTAHVLVSGPGLRVDNHVERHCRIVFHAKASILSIVQRYIGRDGTHASVRGAQVASDSGHEYKGITMPVLDQSTAPDPPTGAGSVFALVGPAEADVVVVVGKATTSLETSVVRGSIVLLLSVVRVRARSEEDLVGPCRLPET